MKRSGNLVRPMRFGTGLPPASSSIRAIANPREPDSGQLLHYPVLAVVTRPCRRRALPRPASLSPSSWSSRGHAAVTAVLRCCSRASAHGQQTTARLPSYARPRDSASPKQLDSRPASRRCRRGLPRPRSTPLEPARARHPDCHCSWLRAYKSPRHSIRPSMGQAKRG